MLDSLAKEYGFSEFRKEKKFFGQVSTGQIQQEKVILLKPETYMNISGKAVGALMRFYKLSPEDVLVLYDDLDTDFGNIKYKPKGGSGGHNGIKSLIAAFGSQEFSRVKFGILNSNKDIMGAASFVLQKFLKEELEHMDDLYTGGKAKILDWIEGRC